MIDYPYLPSGRKILYVPADIPFMKEAMVAAKNLSSSSRQSTGAVVVKGGEIIGRGANQSLLKNPKLQELHSRFCIRTFLKVKTGTKYWLCPGCGGFRVHAEVRALLDVQKKGEDALGADLYLWGHWWCCKSCWDTMIKAGIKNVYLLEGSEKLFDSQSLRNVLGRQFN